MERLKCDTCGKIIEGYSNNHVSYLMMQHELTHKKDTKKNGKPKK